VVAIAPGGSPEAVPILRPANGRYTLATERSTIEFVGAKVTGTHEGGFKTFVGTATLDGKPEAGSVEVEIDMNSVFTDNDKLTEHLRSADFFEVEQHPKASFVSTNIEPQSADGTHPVVGNLTLHGETKSITFPATIALSGKTMTVTAEFSIHRKDFGITYSGITDDLIADAVLIKLNLTFEPQPEN
jgi:polyisoprenoid-binding protein YceI